MLGPGSWIILVLGFGAGLVIGAIVGYIKKVEYIETQKLSDLTTEAFKDETNKQ